MSEANEPVTLWPDYWRDLRGNSTRLGHFTVSTFGGPAALVPRELLPDVACQFVMSLHELAARSYVCDVSSDIHARPVLQDACARDRGRWRIEPGAIEKLVDLVVPKEEHAKGASLLFDFGRASRALVGVLAEAYDPMAISNLGAVSPSAVKAARRLAKTGRVVCVAHRGLGWLSVFAGADALARILRAVCRQCRTTDRFRKLYGPGRSIQSKTGTSGTGFRE